MRGHFLKSQIEKKSQKVAPLFKIVALFKENFGATFWRFLTQKVAPSDLKHLVTLAFIYLWLQSSVRFGFLVGKKEKDKNVELCEYG